MSSCGSSKHWYLLNNLIPSFTELRQQSNFFSFRCCSRKLLFYSLINPSLISLYPEKNLMCEMGQGKVSCKNKLPLKRKNTKTNHSLKILSDNSLMFFSQTIIRTGLLTPAGHASISTPIFFHSHIMKYHWGYIPTIWKINSTFQISRELCTALKYSLDSIRKGNYSIVKLNNISVTLHSFWLYYL